MLPVAYRGFRETLHPRLNAFDRYAAKNIGDESQNL
jgi:hypothetical protein